MGEVGVRPSIPPHSSLQAASSSRLPALTSPKYSRALQQACLPACKRPLDPTHEKMRILTWPCLLLLSLPLIHGPSSVYAACEFSVFNRGSLYNFSLTRPSPKYPHGVLSEDGFYKVSQNGTLLWFQPCEQMVFNHDPPRCFDCQGCGSPSRCGMECSALVANNIGGYLVCTAAGEAFDPDISLIDGDNPEKGVILKMSAVGSKRNCSLSVSIFCDSNGIIEPDLLDRSGPCDYDTELGKNTIANETANLKGTPSHFLGNALYSVSEATVLRHPSGCPKIISVNRGGGWGWFGTLITVLLCIFLGYLVVGAVYRFFFLGIRGPEVVPHLQFWLGLPQRLKSFLTSLSRRFEREPRGNRSSFTQATF